jgi:hypothetical protein
MYKIAVSIASILIASSLHASEGDDLDVIDDNIMYHSSGPVPVVNEPLIVEEKTILLDQ